MTGNTGRYAVYFAPEPLSPLARFGAAWLGYDAATGALVPQPSVDQTSAERLRAITAEPRHYGFHATLKPPFALADGSDAAALDMAVAALAAGFPAFAAPPLKLERISGFWALVPSAPCPMLDRLAAVCVAQLDRFRMPPSPEELARRRRAGLSLRQEMLLQRWGYPYVMEEFRFHMTLTGRLDDQEAIARGRLLAPLVQPFRREELTIGAIGLFHQPDRDRPFQTVRRYPLTG